MKIIIHLPKDEKALKKLQMKFAEIHADSVIKKLNSLPISYEQKLRIIQELKEENTIQ